MEESQNTENQTQQVSSDTPQTDNGVSFPSVPETKKTGSGAKTILIVGILVLVGILGFVIYKSAGSKSGEITGEPTPYENLTNPIEGESEGTSVPTSTPKSEARADVKIQVQNGTGISGEAAYLQTQLKTLGYENITVGNYSQQDVTTTKVSFSGSVPTSFVTEITNKLNTLYQSVSTTTSSSTTYDVVIITGLRKGSTPKPSASSTPKPTSTATPSATPTATP